MRKTILAIFVLVSVLMFASSAFACGCNSGKTGANTLSGQAVESGEAGGQGQPTNGVVEPQNTTTVETQSGESGGQSPDTPQSTAAGGVVEPISGETPVPTLYTYAEPQPTLVATEAQVMHVKEVKAQKAQELENEAQNATPVEQNVLRNQNEVRTAVHTLLEMENLTGGIGPQVSAIAREFNNSVQSTINAEEKIQSRNAITRFFAGGDSETANALLELVNQSNARINSLRQIVNICDCDEQIKLLLQEQIQSMEQEQTRLKELADKETKSKGLFGWLWK